MLSLFELKAILLISSVKTLCLSLLNFCCVFNINLLFFTLREKCPNTELFLVRIFMYLFQLQENTERNKSVFGHFSRSVIYSLCFVTKETNHFFFGWFFLLLTFKLSWFQTIFYNTPFCAFCFFIFATIIYYLTISFCS